MLAQTTWRTLGTRTNFYIAVRNKHKTDTEAARLGQSQRNTEAQLEVLKDTPETSKKVPVPLKNWLSNS